jgi:stringent starvation protein B
VSVPVGAVIAIYARETGQGMALPEDIGDDSGHESGIAGLPQDAPARPSLSAVPSDPATQDEDGGPDKGPDAPGPRRGGHLKVVK